MSKGKLFMILLGASLLLVLFTPQSIAWPSDDQGGPYYVMAVDDAPVIDGETSETEWQTDEELFLETFDQNLVYPNGQAAGIKISLVMVRNANTLYVKVGYEQKGANSLDQPNSIGIAFAGQDPEQMSQTYDRKVAFWDGTAMNNTDYFNCLNYQQTESNLTKVGQYCVSHPNFVQPGVPDTTQDFEAQFGIYENQGFFEFAIPMNPTNQTEDWKIGEGTYLEFVVNPFGNIAGTDVGHGGVGSAPLFIQYEERCFFCRPLGPIEPMALIFNTFFALLISGIYLTLLFAGRSENFAGKLWKVDVSEDQAKESVIMEMAYYNSSFLSIMISAFFLMFSVIGFIYGIWANWGLTGYVMYGVPSLIGAFTIYDLIQRNENPQESKKERPGTDYSEANNFWLVPTLFLGITLMMLVFIGLAVIG